MNFDFSDDLKLLREQARKFLAEKSSPKAVRQVLEGTESYDKALWSGIAELGWLGAAVPEEFGGAGLGYEALCVLAEELGRALAPVPVSSSIYLAATAILQAGNPLQQQTYLPKLASGAAIGCLALAEGPGNPDPRRVRATVAQGKLSGRKFPVADGNIADFAVVMATDTAGKLSLFLVDLTTPAVRRTALNTIDPSRDQAALDFDHAPAELLGPVGQGFEILSKVLDRAAILLAFEQVGGAQACLEMAKAYAMERFAFGRPIASFQAIKHKLADVYVALELARSNAYYGAFALATEAAELPLAAAAARVAAIEAFHLAAKENIQTHGGMGFTWEFDCHLYYRRSKLLALSLGSAPYWKERLVTEIELRNAG